MNIIKNIKYALLFGALLVTPIFAFATESGSVVDGLVCPHGAPVVPFPQDYPYEIEGEGDPVEGIPYKNTQTRIHNTDVFNTITEYKCPTNPTEPGGAWGEFYSLGGYKMSNGYDKDDCTIDKYYYILCHAPSCMNDCYIAVKMETPKRGTAHEYKDTPEFDTSSPEVYLNKGEQINEMRHFETDDFLLDGSSLNTLPYIKSGNTCQNRGGYYEYYKCKHCAQHIWKYVPNPSLKCIDNNFDAICDRCGKGVLRAAKPSAPQVAEVTANQIVLRIQTSLDGVVKFSFDDGEYTETRIYNVDPGTTHTVRAKVFTAETSQKLDSFESNALTVKSKAASTTPTPTPKVTPKPTQKVNPTPKNTVLSSSKSYKSTKLPGPIPASKTSKLDKTTNSNKDLHNKTTYTVLKGDTLKSIAEAFKTTEAKIRQKNNLSATDKIKVGQTLVIWNGTELNKGEPESIYQSPLREDKRLSGITTTDGTKYKVGEGDSLIDIADAAGIEFTKFIKGNSLKDIRLFKVSKVLKIK